MLHRIKEYIDSKGMNIAQFERSIGMSNASFGKSLKNNGAIGSDKIEKILSTYTDINPDWLLTGKGEMLRTNDENLRITQINSPDPQEKPSLIQHMAQPICAQCAAKDAIIADLRADKERLLQIVTAFAQQGTAAQPIASHQTKARSA